MIGNAHLDPVWLWRWTEGYQEARATLASAVTLLDENPDYVFTLDQVVLLSWVEESDPELFDRVREHVRSGRLEVVGGWWVEPDCNMPSSESFARQGLVAQRFLRDQLGSWPLSAATSTRSGTTRCCRRSWPSRACTRTRSCGLVRTRRNLPSTAFWWEAPDGSRVLAYRIAHEYCGPGGDVAYHVEKAVNQLSQTPATRWSSTAWATTAADPRGRTSGASPSWTGAARSAA